MEETALEKSLKPRFSASKASLIYFGIALIFGLLNFYAYLSGSWVPTVTMEEQQKVFADISPIWRNLFIIRVAAIALSIYVIWKNTKNYKMGLAMPDNKWGFAGAIVLAVFTALFVLIKIAHVQDFVNGGLIMLTFIISDAFFIALGVFLMRMSNASKALKVLVPIVGNLIVYLITFFGLFAMGNTYTDITGVVAVIAFIAIITVFFVGTYLLTHRLFVAMIFAILWGFAVAAQANENMATIGLSSIIALVGIIICAGGGIAAIVAYFCMKNPPSEKLCEYEPADEGFGAAEVMNAQAVLNSPRTLFLTLISIFSMAGTFLVTSWDDITDLTIGIFDFLEDLLTWNFASNGEFVFDLQETFITMLENGIVLTLIPVLFLAIAYLLFYISKEQRHVNKYRIGWRFAKIAVVLYMIMDVIIAAMFLTFSATGFFSKLPEAMYKDNYILDYLAHFNFMSWITYVVVGVMAILLLYHIALFIKMHSLSKGAGNEQVRSGLFYPVLIMTIIVGIPSLALAFWYTGFIQPIISILDGAVFIILANMLLTVYKKKI